MIIETVVLVELNHIYLGIYDTFHTYRWLSDLIITTQNRL